MSELPFKCYETFRDGYIAFERGGRFYFGPIAKLPALLSGSSESFLLDDAAEAKVAELHERQAANCVRNGADIIASETDQLAITRKRWAHERRSGHWERATK
jgi:hypothetical protein